MITNNVGKRRFSAMAILLILIIATTSIVFAQTVIRITIIGDSTVRSYPESSYPQAGWGQMLGLFFKTGSVVINNKAIGGRSSRSFYQEGSWAGVVSGLQKSEYVFIQFGHNDRDVSHVERYTDTANYKEYLRKYINESRAIGAIPVLVSPMNMNIWTDATVREIFCEGVNNYRGAMLNVAKELNAPFIDLEKKTVELQKRVGQKYCDKFIYLGLDSGEYPNFPNGISDRTHFQEMGANFLAKFVCEGMIELKSYPDMTKLASFLKPLYSVNIISNQSKSGMITESGNTFPEGVPISIKVIPDDCDKFIGSYGQTGKIFSTETNYRFTMKSEDVVVAINQLDNNAVKIPLNTQGK